MKLNLVKKPEDDTYQYIMI